MYSSILTEPWSVCMRKCVCVQLETLSYCQESHKSIPYLPSLCLYRSNGPKSPLLYIAISVLVLPCYVVTEPCVEVAVSLNSW